MMTVKWSNAYSVGVEEIDIQHRRLFEIVNNYLESAGTGDQSAPEKLLINIVEFTDTHFKTEEKYFDLFHYPESENHKKMHREFRTKVMGFVSNYRSRGTVNTVIIMDALKKWIIDHTLIYDRKYVRCFHENGLH